MSMRRVAVIGSNSFSGSDFIDLLLNDSNTEVLALSRSPQKSALFLPYLNKETNGRLQFQQADLNRDMDAMLARMDAFEPEYIVNFAAQSEVAPSWEHPEDWFQTNTVALARMINHLKGRPYLKKYLHVSSPEAYGTCVGQVYEDAPLNPTTPYAASKAAADLLLATFVKNFSFPLVTVRSTNVYGAHQQLFKIIPRSVISVKKKVKIQLHGGGVAVKSYIHIRDVSHGELAIMEHGKTGELYHLSPDSGVAVKDVVAIICEKLGTRFEVCTQAVEERLGQDAAYVINSEKARRELGWAPKVSLDAGLDEVVKWVDRFWDEILAQPLEYVHQR